MKKTILMSLVALLAIAASLSAGRAPEIVEVDFASLKDMTDNKGRMLDGTIKFVFADEMSSKGEGEEISARGFTMKGGDDVERCKKALLTAFISFQERAKRDEMNSVVYVRTFFDNGTFSKSRKKCLCSAGKAVKTVVRGRLAQSK